jgi:hypothetical protein
MSMPEEFYSSAGAWGPQLLSTRFTPEVRAGCGDGAAAPNILNKAFFGRFRLPVEGLG